MLPVCGHEQKSSETTHLLVAREKGKETKWGGRESDPKIFSYVGVKKSPWILLRQCFSIR